jgi:hypothetical protein
MKHLYAITATIPDLRSLPRGLEGSRVERVPEAGLVAFVSTHRQIPTWNENTVWQHERVVESLMESCTVLPGGLGTFLASEDEVRGLLRGRHDEFADDLRRLVGCIEICVHIPGQDLPVELQPVVTEWRPHGSSVACLLAARSLDDLLAEVAALEAREGISIVVTGPWPPYSFVSDISTDRGRVPA